MAEATEPGAEAAGGVAVELEAACAIVGYCRPAGGRREGVKWCPGGFKVSRFQRSIPEIFVFETLKRETLKPASGDGASADVRMKCRASAPRDAFPPTPPGPEGS